ARWRGAVTRSQTAPLRATARSKRLIAPAAGQTGGSCPCSPHRRAHRRLLATPRLAGLPGAGSRRSGFRSRAGLAIRLAADRPANQDSAVLAPSGLLARLFGPDLPEAYSPASSTANRSFR